MTLYIRDKNNRTIVDIEYFTEKYDESDEKYLELSVSFDIQNYSMLLLKLDMMSQAQFIADFVKISELRNWLWEGYFGSEKNSDIYYTDVLNNIKIYLKENLKEYKLILVED